VSIAAAHRGRLLAAVVYDPERDECFAAAAGQGATLNGKRITASGVGRVADALLAVSFPAHITPQSPDIEAFLRIAPLCQAIRRTGSAALNLAYVACGRLDGHWAHDINPWDAAAGVLLVQEAGGVATAAGGQPFNLAEGNYLAAATARLHAALAPLVRT
jgi:myo-inositol-1(or 4)-monophosphatase